MDLAPHEQPQQAARIQLQGLVEVVQGLLLVVLHGVQSGPQEIPLGLLRTEGNQFVDVLQSVIVLFEFFEDAGHRRQGILVFGVGGQELVEIGNGFVVFAFFGVENGPELKSFQVFGVGLHGEIKILHLGVEILDHPAAEYVGLRQFRRVRRKQVDGFIHGFLGDFGVPPRQLRVQPGHQQIGIGKLGIVLFCLVQVLEGNLTDQLPVARGGTLLENGLRGTFGVLIERGCRQFVGEFLLPLIEPLLEGTFRQRDDFFKVGQGFRRHLQISRLVEVLLTCTFGMGKVGKQGKSEEDEKSQRKAAHGMDLGVGNGGLAGIVGKGCQTSCLHYGVFSDGMLCEMVRVPGDSLYWAGNAKRWRRNGRVPVGPSEQTASQRISATVAHLLTTFLNSRRWDF